MKKDKKPKQDTLFTWTGYMTLFGFCVSRSEFFFVSFAFFSDSLKEEEISLITNESF